MRWDATSRQSQQGGIQQWRCCWTEVQVDCGHVARIHHGKVSSDCCAPVPCLNCISMVAQREHELVDDPSLICWDRKTIARVDQGHSTQKFGCLNWRSRLTSDEKITLRTTVSPSSKTIDGLGRRPQISRLRGCNDVECLQISAARVCQRLDDFEEIHYARRPAVKQEERYRGPSRVRRCPFMNVMQLDVLN